MSLEYFAAPAVLVGSDGREHDICCRLLVRGDNPLRDFVGTLHGDLDGIAWSELVGHRVMIGLEDHNYWVHIVTAREHSADIEDFAHAGARPHLVGVQAPAASARSRPMRPGSDRREVHPASRSRGTDAKRGADPRHSSVPPP